MEKNGSIRALNERLARKVRREGQADPKFPYPTRFVGLANGKVVVIADTLTDASRDQERGRRVADVDRHVEGAA